MIAVRKRQKQNCTDPPGFFCMTGVRRQKRRYNEALSIYYIVILFGIYRKEITLNDIIILDIIII